MNKRSNKGFTLVELLIAMSIFSVVTFIGYKIINGIVISTKGQQVITNAQLNANLCNKYLTKDLENYSINEFENLNTLNKEELKLKLKSDSQYKYVLGPIEYIVKKDKTKKEYDIVRKSVDGEIDIVKNQPIGDSSLPMYIGTEKDGMYSVEISHLERKGKLYSFDITPRIITSSIDVNLPDPPPVVTPPEVDDELEGKPDVGGETMGNGYIKFEYDESNSLIDSIGNGKGQKGNIRIEGGYIDQNSTPHVLEDVVGTSELNEFNIHVKLSTENNNGKIDATMQKSKSQSIGKESFLQDSKIFGMMPIDTTNLTIIDSAEVQNLNITCNIKPNLCRKHENETVYEEGKHSFKITIENGQHGGILEGKMIKKGSYGSVIITFGKLK